jgi:hypothetical protein
MKGQDIPPEHELVNGGEAFSLPRVKKCRKCLWQGRTDLFDDRRSGKPVTKDSGDEINSVP